jgi:hypothetical protein
VDLVPEILPDDGVVFAGVALPLVDRVAEVEPVLGSL